MVAFRRAQRTQAKLKIALTGPSGAGKTYSALLIASGIGKRIALIDTENGSASLYSKQFEFDTVVLQPPYTIPKYIEAIRAAEEAKYDVLIIDSISHAWAGEGGLLAKKEALDARSSHGNTYVTWGAITKEHEQFKAMLLNCNIHLICTMRSKQDYVLDTNDRGKQVPKKVGLAPIQRDGMEYEFTTVLDLGMDHSAQTSKDRTGLFDGQIFKPTKATGEALTQWLQDDLPVTPSSAPVLSQTSVASTAPPERSGVACPKCGAEPVLVPNKEGYSCPNWKVTKDGHLRFHSSLLAEVRAKHAAFKQSQGGTHGTDDQSRPDAGAGPTPAWLVQSEDRVL